ncbi:MAG: transglycosylase SLT domain-containing protein [Syntrophorhabdales bacterium]|jgi:hypothetical protein
MKRWIVFAAIAGLGVVLAVHGTVRATDDPFQPGESSCSGERTFFDPVGKDNPGETGFDIGDDIARGQEFLKGRIAGNLISIERRRVVVAGRKGRKREKIIVQRTVKPNFLLAVEDLREKKIREVLVTADGWTTEEFEVKMVRRNGVGSRFEIAYPENMVLLALRTTVRAGKNSFKEVVYTPYSPQIDTPQVRQAGLKYLMTQIELARKDLERRQARLYGFERLSTDMPTDVSLALSIIEHIDPVRFKNCPKGKETELIDEVLTIMGANTVNAYAYSRSPAGAMGLFQIIPPTYKRLRNKYPRAGLIKDFLKGCADHVNAAKASLLLFDSDLSDLPNEHLQLITKDPRTIGMYLAAAYNCGSKRVEKSVKQCGSEWTCHLPLETKIYLDKFYATWDSGIMIDK